MSRENSSAAATLALGLMVMTLVGQCYGQLSVKFYKGKCGTADVEQVIFDIVEKKFSDDPTLAAAMLRMLFHDCFVGGCDASILLDVPNSEKTALPNKTVRGYEIIDEIKTALENMCSGVVSCADIIVITTRVTVYLARGRKYWYDVETGRGDGLTSLESEARKNLPSPNEPVSSAISKFQAKNLSIEDFVLLLGGHTVGIVHCELFQDRLYNYNGPGTSDPNIDKGFLSFLKNVCPANGSGGNFTVLDQSTPETVDNNFYGSIVARRGVLQIDQDMALDPLTSSNVSHFATNSVDFNVKFGVALNNLARVEVLTQSKGQIRKSCRSVNMKSKPGIKKLKI